MKTSSLSLTEADKETARKIEQYIIENYNQKITRNAICNYFFVNKKFLSKKFPAVTGMFYEVLQTQLRMSEAVKQLQSNTLMKIIAANVGYNSSQSFTRAFKKHFGISPKEFLQKKVP